MANDFKVQVLFRGAKGQFIKVDQFARESATQLARQLGGGSRYVEAGSLYSGAGEGGGWWGDAGGGGGGSWGGGGGSHAITYIVGSELPYASRWIELGVRERTRDSGDEIYINYAKPEAADFLQAGADAVGHELDIDEFRSVPVGVMLDSYTRHLADTAVDAMKARLNEITYSRPSVNTNGTRERRWKRSHDLYNSIKAHRLD